ncbi:MAG: hypothetical protein ABI663_17035 [Chryseolinea sp.]
MAIVRSNPIVEGLSGRLGKSLVFKMLREKIILASRPAPPKTQSEQQWANRNKFRDASFWAKSVLLDPLKKEYYQRKAKKLKLPNAYTAAIADYMRKAQVKETARSKNSITYRISKKDFNVKGVKIKKTDANGELVQTLLLTRDRINGWSFTLNEEEKQRGVYVNIMNEGGNTTVIKIE